jgi:hypothetical protein
MSGPFTIRPKQWRDLYDDAVRESSNPILQQTKVHVAISACLGRLLELAPEMLAERKAISIALDDLKVVRAIGKRLAESSRYSITQVVGKYFRPPVD